MHLKAQIHAMQPQAPAHVRLVVYEAASLLRRRKLSYALLAIALITGAIYASNLQIVAAPSSNSSANSGRPDDLMQDQTLPHEAIRQPGGNQQQANDSHSAAGPFIQNNQTSVTVNGQDVPIPANGEVHTVTTNDGSTTSVSVSHDSSAGSSSSSLYVDISSQSTSGQEGN